MVGPVCASAAKDSLASPRKECGGSQCSTCPNGPPSSSRGGKGPKAGSLGAFPERGCPWDEWDSVGRCRDGGPGCSGGVGMAGAVEGSRCR